jgi:LmbE family N-acetylglucosaminyl deacetylase
MTRPFTIVAFHAHPDDESLLTGGTLARAAAEGHRVVLVVATRGEAGGTGGEAGGTAGEDLGARRLAELHRAAAELGCARVVELGYHDSGLHGDAYVAPGGAPRFVDVPVEQAAAPLIDVLREECADILTGYDERGGYGHPDHRQVHLVARFAAAAAATPVLLEATVSRGHLGAVLRFLRPIGRLLPRLPLSTSSEVYAAGRDITHTVDVRKYWRQKRAGLRAHTSQTQRSRGVRIVALLGLLPAPLFRLFAGREWFIDADGTPGAPQETDIFAGLR